MSNINFVDEIVKRNYQNVIKENRGISTIILNIAKESDGLIINNVDNTEMGLGIELENNNGLIFINVDLLKKKIYVVKPNLPYQEIYDNYPKKTMHPVGHLYKNNDREITETFKFRLTDGDDIKYYLLNENGSHYSIIINVKDMSFWEDLFITKILYNYCKYNSIRDLFLAIIEVLDTNHFDVKLGDSKGSNISIVDGTTKEYVEYYDEDNQYIKIYLEDGQFYYERKVKEIYKDNMTSFVKKLGENNGKEKR